jgi:hypothetical protein
MQNLSELTGVVHPKYDNTGSSSMLAAPASQMRSKSRGRPARMYESFVIMSCEKTRRDGRQFLVFRGFKVLEDRWEMLL